MKFPASVDLGGAVYRPSAPIVLPPNAGRKKFRCKHKNEPGGYDKTPFGMPEVRPSFDATPIVFTETLQWMHWNAMKYKNGTITSKQWRAVMDCERWATNYQGWDCTKGLPQRADYVNGYTHDKITGVKLNDPYLMKAIIMGGSLYTGVPDYTNNLLWMYPGVDGINALNPCTWQDALKFGWYFECISWEFDKKVSMFPQGNGARVYSLFFLKEPSSYPLSWFQEWTSSTPPDPLVYYL